MLKLRGIYTVAADQASGFGAEQILYNRGFHELGRRTHATAWSVQESNEVVRISADGVGSNAYCDLAKALQGNPYMPVILEHKIMPSTDHIALVEKLENPAQKHIYPRFVKIREELASGSPASEADVRWFEEVKYMGMMSARLSNFFMSKTHHLDIETLPNPDAFREAATAITDLTMKMYQSNSRYVPIPDMNPTNIMWRKTETGLHPVLYDAVTLTHSGKQEELEHAPSLRQKLGMPNPALSP